MSEDRKVEVTNDSIETTEASEKRQPSAGELRTDRFKQHIQAMLKRKFDIKVSKETAWQFFKEMQVGLIQFVVSEEDKKVALSGVGNYEIILAQARGKAKERGESYLPKFRFYPSTATDRTIRQLMGLDPITEAIEGIGIFDEDSTDHFAAQAVINKEWADKKFAEQQEKLSSKEE